MNEDTQAEKSIVQEFTLFGKQIADAIRAAWESEDRKKLQAELTEGLQKFEAEVSEAMEKAGQSDAAKTLRVQAEKVVADVKESKATDDVRKGLISGLEVLNRELGQLVEKLEAKAPAAAPQVDEVASVMPGETPPGPPSEPPTWLPNDPVPTAPSEPASEI